MPEPTAAHPAPTTAAPPNGAAPHDGLNYSVTPEAAEWLDVPAQECIAALKRWITSHAADFAVVPTEMKVWHWRSIEDPRDHNVVIDVHLQGATDEVQRFWTAAGEELDALMERNPSPANDLLTLGVHWL